MAWTLPRTWTDGELVTAAIMNAHVRDNLLTVPHLIARKASDQSVTSSTVVVDCTTMTAPVTANEVWFFWWNITFTASTTGDIKFGFTFPASGHISHNTTWGDPSGAAQVFFWQGTTTPTTGFGLQSNSSTNQQTAVIQGLFTTAGTAGNVQLQFAQSTSDGTATTVKANSNVMGMKLA